MSTLSIRLPKSLHEKLKKSSSSEGVSINQLVTLAVTEKLAVLETLDYLHERARKGSREKFDDVLNRVPDVKPEPKDRLL